MTGPRDQSRNGPGRGDPAAGPRTDDKGNWSCAQIAPVPAACPPDPCPAETDPAEVSARRGQFRLVEAMRAAGSVDPWQLRRECPVAFAAFLAEAFRADTRLIALHFDVNEKTARNWLSGTHGPHGDKMLVAMRSHPDVFAKHLLKVA